MPTEPHHDVLYRELSVVRMKELAPSPTKLLQEVVNFGTNAFVRCKSSLNPEDEENVHLAPFSLYRQILELTDGIEILVSAASPAVAQPLLRNSFEALLGLEFILEDRSHYRNRSLAWLTGYVRATLRTYASLLPKTTEGQTFLDAVKEDKSIRTFPLPPEDRVVEAMQNLERLLATNQFKPIVAEYDRHNREPHWYAAFKGPSNLRDLARHLGRTAQYDVLYRGWSMSAHAQDFRPFLARGASGKAEIRGIRNLDSTYQVTTFATTFILDATRQLIQQYHPGEEWAPWYFREVQQAYVQCAQAYSRH